MTTVVAFFFYVGVVTTFFVAVAVITYAGHVLERPPRGEL